MASGYYEAAAAAASAFGQSQSDRKGKKMAREIMAWEQKMSNTAHEREVRDLKRAGLNPILSANAGASTPSISAPSFNNVAAAGIASAKDAANTSLMKQQQAASIILTGSQSGKLQAETDSIKESTRGTTEQIKGYGFDNTLKKLKIPEQRVINNLWSTAEKALPAINAAVDAIQKFAEEAKNNPGTLKPFILKTAKKVIKETLQYTPIGAQAALAKLLFQFYSEKYQNISDYGSSNR